MKRHVSFILLLSFLFAALCAVVPVSATESTQSTGNLKTQGYILSVSTSTHSGSSYDLPNGMSVFYLLSDGTFLVFDGGQGTYSASIDAKHLCAQLKAVAKENNLDENNIVVSAWVFTHAHQDHHGFARWLFSNNNDAKKARAGIQVREFWYNDISDSSEDEVEKLIKAYYNSPSPPIRELVLGEKIVLADVVVEVMLTPEALKEDLPNAFDEDNGGDFNNSSLVLKLTIGTQTVLMTGDATVAAWDWMVEKYPKVNGVSKLKSDILQVPHHGSATAGTNEGYDLVDASKLVYPAGERLYKNCVNSSTNQYQASTVYAIEKTAAKNGDTSLSATDLTTLLTKNYFYLAGEYLDTETDLTDTRKCFITSDVTGVDYSATTQMLSGASVRIVPQATNDETLATSGIRFMSTVPKATLDAADALVANEKLNVASYSFGTLIFKASSLDKIAGPVSKDALKDAGEQCVDISAKDGIKKNSDGSWTLFAALVDLKESNYSVDFAAISYIEYQLDNGETIRVYSDFNREDNVRSMARVAKAALADTSSEKITDRLVDGFYYDQKIAVGETYYIKGNDGSFTAAVNDSDSLYSPYTYSQRIVLRMYLNSNAGTLAGFDKDDTAKDPW